MDQPKSVKQKTLEELENDVKAMNSFQEDRQDLVNRGLTAESEIAKRLGHELNLKAGYDLFVERKGQAAVNKANRKQYDPTQDVVMITVVIDNNYAKNASEALDERSTLSLLKQALEKHLPAGTDATAISLKGLQRENLRLFSDTFTRFTTALSFHNKATATAIQKKYRNSFPFDPTKHIPIRE